MSELVYMSKLELQKEIEKLRTALAEKEKEAGELKEDKKLLIQDLKESGWIEAVFEGKTVLYKGKVMMDDLIDVNCIVVPSGDTLWMEPNDDPNYPFKVFGAWKEQNPEYTDTKCTNGMVTIKMPRGKYESIPAINGFKWPLKTKEAGDE